MFPLTNDAVVLGLLLAVLALVFTAQHRFPAVFRVLPALLLCYFIPALLNWPLGVVDPGESNLYFVASRYLLPASLVLLCLGTDLRGIARLGPKAVIMFLTATLGIVIGGPIALLLCTWAVPDLFAVPPEQLWRGLATIAGSWIGGGANQTAMREIYGVSGELFSSMVVVDIIVANLWLAVLLYGAGVSERIDRWLGADSSAILDLERRVTAYQQELRTQREAELAVAKTHPEAAAKTPTRTLERYQLFAIAFGGVAIAHFLADIIAPYMERHADVLAGLRLNSLTSSFFWMVVIATTLGLVASLTRLRKFEGAGASNWGSLFIYVLVATIGMEMNIGEALKNPGLFAVGLVWILVHVGLLLGVAKLIRAPFFFVAVGSQANVGGAASAPVVAQAFSPTLMPVGVLLAVLGYALGTYGAILCAQLMRAVVE